MPGSTRYRAAAKAARPKARAAAVAALTFHTARQQPLYRAVKHAAAAARRTYRAQVQVHLARYASH